jgi:hypothetical protein
MTVIAARTLGRAKLLIEVPPSLCIHPIWLISTWSNANSTEQDLREGKPRGSPPIWRPALSIHQGRYARDSSHHFAQYAALDHSQGLADQGHEAGQVGCARSL